MNHHLFELEKKLKHFLAVFLVVLSIGVLVGLSFLYYTTNYSATGAVTRFNGSEVNQDDEFAIPENYPKPISEMLITTHNHIFAFALIFFALGGIFYFNSLIKGFWKVFFLTEPLLSVIVTFGSIWLVRFVNPDFIILTIISSTFIYISYFIMVSVCLYELLFKKPVEN